MPHFCKCSAFFQVWRHFPSFIKRTVFFQVRRIFPSLAQFSKCAAFVQVWRNFSSVRNPDLSGKSHDTHKCLERKMSLGLAAFDLLTSIKLPYIQCVVDPMVLGISRPTSIAGRRGLESCSFQRLVTKATGKLFKSFFHCF